MHNGFINFGTVNFRMEVTYDEFKKLNIRIGKIVSAEKVEGADKLIKLQIGLEMKQDK